MSSSKYVELLLDPTPGLTFEQRGIEANIHEVHDGIVFWGRYAKRKPFPLSLHQTALTDWSRLEKKAISGGASVFCLIDAMA